MSKISGFPRRTPQQGRKRAQEVGLPPQWRYVNALLFFRPDFSKEPGAIDIQMKPAIRKLSLKKTRLAAVDKRRGARSGRQWCFGKNGPPHRGGIRLRFTKNTAKSFQTVVEGLFIR